MILCQGEQRIYYNEFIWKDRYAEFISVVGIMERTKGGMVGNMASISGSYIPTDDGIVLNAKVHKRSAFRTDGIDKCDTEKMISEPRD